jgi:Na+-driven multidrug efflux pump
MMGAGAMGTNAPQRKDSVTPVSAPAGPRKMPPVLGRLFSGTLWLALQTPIQAVCALWTTRLILEAIGPDRMGAYRFAWGFGFFQFLLEFGISSALQRQVSECWTRGDQPGVDRAIACGMSFYATMALVQVAALLGVAYGAVPYSAFVGDADSYRLIIKLLWLQVLTAPCYGLSVVISSVLQAARRYEFMPRLELLVTILRFLILLGGVKLGVDFFLIVVGQTAAQVGVTLAPGAWVVVRELGHPLRFRGARLADYLDLMHVSAYIFLIQLSVVLADKFDTTILGFVLPKSAAGHAIAVYDVVSKPFMQTRQTGWMLSYMVMPAVASLAAARDFRGLDRVKYDGSRLHTGVLLPVGLLAFVYAAPFLSLWVGDRLGHDAAEVAWLMRLFLVGTIPLLISVPVQMAIGVGRVRVIALSALAGSLVNLPVSYLLTVRLQDVSGVIWGTVLTTLFSNLLVPGVYVFRVVEVRMRTYLARTLGAPAAGGAALLATCWLCRAAAPVPPAGAPVPVRTALLVAHLTAGCLAYAAGYLAVPAGRSDLAALARKVWPRPVSSEPEPSPG